MSAKPDQASWAEVPLFIDSTGGTLFAVLTEPLGEPRGVAVVHVRDGNHGPSSGRSRSSALLCRRLASEGFHALRFDYHGVGESTGEIDHFRMNAPFKEDVEACAALLRDLGLKRLALVGECFGARTTIACHDLTGLEAAALIGIPLRDAEKISGTTRPIVRHRSLIGYAVHALKPSILREMIDPILRRRYLVAAHNALKAKPYPRGGAFLTKPGWVSQPIVGDLDGLTSRGLPVLLLNGRLDPGYEDFNRAREGTLGEILKRSANTTSVMTLDGRIAACADASVVEPTINHLRDWLRRVLPSEPSPHAAEATPTPV